MPDRRRRDAHVHLARARVAQHLHDLARRVAAHDRVVDDDEALAGDDLGQRVELHPQAVLAQLLARLDERARDVAVLDEAVVLRQPAARARSRGRRRCRSRAPRSRGRPRPAPRARGSRPCARARPAAPGRRAASPAARSRCARTRTARCRAPCDRHARLDPALRQRDDLAGLHVAQEARADDVERARLRGHAVAARPSMPSESGRRPAGSRNGDDAVLGHHHGRVRALEPPASRPRRRPRSAPPGGWRAARR